MRMIQLAGMKVVVSALASYLRVEIKKRGWSQNQLAAKADLRESTISNIFNNPRVRPKPETLRKLAFALEVPEARLTALAGYAIDEHADPDDRVLRLARQIREAPWLAAGVEKWMQLPPADQEEILEQIEFRLSRRGRTG